MNFFQFSIFWRNLNPDDFWDTSELYEIFFNQDLYLGE